MAMRIRLKKYDAYSIDTTGYITSARLVYHCDELGTQSTADILRAVKTAAAAVIENSALASVELVDLPHADCCDVAVNYGAKNRVEDTAFTRRKRQAGDELWGFSVGGGTATVRTAIEQLFDDGDPLLTENVADYVGWNGKFGEAFQCSGVNVPVPEVRETCRRTVAASSVTSSLRRTIAGLRGKVNSATFHDWNPGEVMFDGATFSEPYANEDGDTLVDVNYSFSIRLNETGREIGSFSLPDVNGWDYAWGISGFDPATQQNDVLAAFVSRVLDYADLTDLGIGGSSGGSAVVTPAEE